MKLRLIARLTLLTALLIICSFPTSSIAAEKSIFSQKFLVRIHKPDPKIFKEIRDKKFILASEEEIQKFVDVLVSREELNWINGKGWKTQILLTPEKLLSIPTQLDPEYHTYNSMVAELESLQTLYPEICKMESLGVSTQINKIMWGFKISDNAALNEDEPVVLYDGAHHACEVMGFEINMRLIRDLLSGYGIDSQVTDWVNNTEIWFIPLVNVDGHDAVADGISLYWRKNARDLDNDDILYEYVCNTWWTCSTEGIDLNRNYDWFWNYGGSGEPWNYYYRGSAPFSEGETRAVRDLAVREKPSLYITYHSYGEIVLYPWYDEDNRLAPDQAVLDNIALNIASKIPAEFSGTYDYGREYYQQGMSFMWMYGTLGTLGFLIETLPYPIFIPYGPDLEYYYQTIKPGVVYLLDRVKGPGVTGNITDSSTGLPLEATVKILNFDLSKVVPRKSEPVFGRYLWLLQPGNYTLEVSHPSYFTRTSSITVLPSASLERDIALIRKSRGDLTQDGSISPADLIYLINYLFKRGPAPQPIEIGDVDCNGKVSPGDLVYLINFLFKNGTPPCEL